MTDRFTGPIEIGASGLRLNSLFVTEYVSAAARQAVDTKQKARRVAGLVAICYRLFQFA
jgi:hypothetical protein